MKIRCGFVLRPILVRAEARRKQLLNAAKEYDKVKSTVLGLEGSEDMLWEVIALVFLLGVGLLMLIKPEVVWKIDHCFTVKNGEPTELYLAITRVSGLVFAAIAVIAGPIILFFG